jgi:uncharacterized delta-60 repeat protein
MQIMQIMGAVAAMLLSTAVLAALPQLDTTFGVAGKRNIWFDLPSEKWDEATDVLVQPDGKIVVVGFARKDPISGTGDLSDLTVARLNADGTNDTSFASNGKLSLDLNNGGRLNDRANAVAMDSAGRIYVAGNTQRFGFVLRLTSTGAVDTSYAYLGRFVFGGVTASDYRFEDIAIDALGRAVVVGTIEQSSGARNEGLALRLLGTGQLDSSFTGAPNAGNSVGFRTLSLLYGQSFNDEIKRVAIAADGSIYAGGSFQGFGNDFDLTVYKLSGSNGALVQSFGTSGVKRSYIDQGDKYDRLVDMKLLPNGNLRLLGNCRRVWGTSTKTWLDGCLQGLTADGALDPAFATHYDSPGFRAILGADTCTGLSGEARALVVHNSPFSYLSVFGESTMCNGSSPNLLQMVLVQAYDKGGILNSFLALPYSTVASWPNAGAVDAQGRLIIVGGTALSASDTDQAVARVVNQ